MSNARGGSSRMRVQAGSKSVQRPLWRAYQQDPEAVRRWQEEEYPRIRRRAKRVGAQIFFGDEAGVRSDFRPFTGLPHCRRPPDSQGQDGEAFC